MLPAVSCVQDRWPPYAAPYPKNYVAVIGLAPISLAYETTEYLYILYSVT